MQTQQAVKAVQIVGEIQDGRAYIIQVAGHYLLEIRRSHEEAEKRIRGEVILTPLRSCAKPFADVHVARSFCSFVQIDYPDATVIEVDTTDRHLAAALHRGKANPVNPEDVAKRSELFKTNIQVRERSRR